jgi:HAE1 family hydrophobic/amphiphilic exporter-1
VTSLTLEFVSSRDIDAAAVDVQAALLRAQRQLPQELTQLPSYRKVNPADAPVLFIALISPSMNPAELNDYAENLISPTLSTIDGVAQVGVYGRKAFAVRIKANADLLNARNITLDELAKAVNSANANTPVGVLDGPRQTLTIQANRQLVKAADFAKLIVGQRNGAPVRLDEVATIEDSFESVKTASSFNGQDSISLAVQRQPNANTVQVVDAVRALIPRFKAELPQSVEIQMVNDRSLSIREAVHDVQLTLLGTIALVVLVIFLFLHRLVATLIPAATIPISLIGAVALLYAFGYSLDNVSLLGITLAVGLVVDDAIVVLENIMRYVEKGMAPMAAALRGAREVGFTIVSISISLVAVFIPIFFMPGVIGLLFHEFAVVVALAVLVSAMVSLTLVPMLASRLLKHVPRKEGAAGHDHEEEHPEPGTAIGRAFERGYRAVHGGYMRSLDWTLGHRSLMLLARADLRHHRLAVRHHSQGLLPRGRHRPDPDHHRGRRRHLVHRHEGAAGPRGRRAQGRPERGLRELLRRRGRPDRHAELGPPVRRAQVAQRAPADGEGARVAAPAFPRDSGHCRLHAAGAEPAPGRAPEQGALPVHAAERERRRDGALGHAS